MHKIIHSSFELDLSSYKIATVEENHWFSDQFFTKYSFPFNIFITEDLKETFGNFLDHNATNIITTYNVKYLFGDILEDGILEVENQTNKLSATLRYGFDALPNFDKKLTELPLEKATITDIIAHAKTIISQTWPAVNYNYPQIHTDKYDATDATWTSFLKIINNYNGSYFIVNTWAVGDLQNKNIIQPLAYLLHILTKGFLDAGYTLKGDVTTNALFKKICVYADLEYYSFELAPLTAVVNKDNFVTIPPVATNYNTDVTLGIANQKYRITGTVRVFGRYNPTTFLWENGIGTITYKTSTLFSGSSNDKVVNIFNIDTEFTTDGDVVSTQKLNLTAIAYFTDYAGVTDPLFDLKMEKVIAGGANEIHLKNEVDLTKVVPDVTFGYLVSDIKNNFNIDLTIVGKDIYMNFIENSINQSDSVDLRNFEVAYPKKSFESDKSFLLKFRNLTDVPTPYLPVYQNATITELNDNNANDNTNTIEINAIPLPQKAVLTVNTAYSFENGGNSSIYYILYDGLTSGLNYAKDPANLFLSAIHASFYNKWFTFRVNAKTYNWQFKMFEEDVSKLIDKFKIFAYGQYHIIKTLDKTQVDKDLFDVKIETETM